MPRDIHCQDFLGSTITRCLSVTGKVPMRENSMQQTIKRSSDSQTSQLSHKVESQPRVVPDMTQSANIMDNQRTLKISLLFKQGVARTSVTSVCEGERIDLL